MHCFVAVYTFIEAADQVESKSLLCVTESIMCHKQMVSGTYIRKSILINTFMMSFLFGVKGKGKGKSIPLQAWENPEDSRRLKLPDFKTIGT